jgi:GNAT superfamily N-acetyltransferase
VIRRATRHDIDTIAAIWRTGWVDGHAGRVPAALERERMTGSWRAQVEARLDRTWVAADEDAHAVGFVTVVGDELEEVYVAATARGTGVAAALLRQGEHVVRDDGYTSAWLAVVDGNARARRFYEREGWRDTGAFEHHARTAKGPIAVPARRYERSLDDLGRDPRFSLHTATIDPNVTDGDAKLWGRTEHVDDDALTVWRHGQPERVIHKH